MIWGVDRGQVLLRTHLRVLVITAVLLSAGCESSYAPIPQAGEDYWGINGVVVAKDSAATFANNQVKLIRLQRKCSFCEMQSVVVSTTNTDERGRFELVSQIPGFYELVSVSPVNGACVARVRLGYLKSKRVNVRIAIPEKDCRIIY